MCVYVACARRFVCSCRDHVCCTSKPPPASGSRPSWMASSTSHHPNHQTIQFALSSCRRPSLLDSLLCEVKHPLRCAWPPTPPPHRRSNPGSGCTILHHPSAVPDSRCTPDDGRSRRSAGALSLVLAGTTSALTPEPSASTRLSNRTTARHRSSTLVRPASPAAPRRQNRHARLPHLPVLQQGVG